MKAAIDRTLSAPRRVYSAIVGSFWALNQMWNMKRPVLVALGVGVVIGAGAYLSAPWLAGVLAGCGAASTTLLAQFVAWSRRLMATFGIR